MTEQKRRYLPKLANGEMIAAVAYTRERQTFGKPLIEMQNTRFKLAEVKSQAVVARTFIDDCIQRMIYGGTSEIMKEIIARSL